jgi:hypothetical protein
MNYCKAHKDLIAFGIMQTRYCEEDRRDCATVERFFSLRLHPKEKHLTYFCLQAIDCLLMKPIEVSFSI